MQKTRLPRRKELAAPVRPVAVSPQPVRSTARGRRRPHRARRNTRGRHRGAVLASIAAHVAILVGLALMFVTADAKPPRIAITIGAAEDPGVEESAAIELVSNDEPDSGAEDALAELEPIESAPALLEPLDVVASSSADAAGLPSEAIGSDSLLATIGGDGNDGTNAATGRGHAGGGAEPGASSFFGRSGTGRSVCFICDNSNSYRDGGFHTVLNELARAVDSLRPDQLFFVIFFSDTAYPMLHPERLDELLPATPDNKQRLCAWLTSVEMCSGGQGIHEAMAIARRLEPEIVYFLSDGDHAPSVVDRVASTDLGPAVLNTFGMQQNPLARGTGRVDPEHLRDQLGFNQNLMTIATAHGGTFTPVLVPPEAAVLERIRPIPKNRSRGPVWGLKL